MNFLPDNFSFLQEIIHSNKTFATQNRKASPSVFDFTFSSLSWLESDFLLCKMVLKSELIHVRFPFHPCRAFLTHCQAGSWHRVGCSVCTQNSISLGKNSNNRLWKKGNEWNTFSPLSLCIIGFLPGKFCSSSRREIKQRKIFAKLNLHAKFIGRGMEFLLQNQNSNDGWMREA